MPSSPASRSPLPAASKSDNDLKRYLETTNSSSTQDSYPTQDPHSFIPQLLPSDSHSSFPDVAVVRDAHHAGSSIYSSSYTLTPTATVNTGASSSIFNHNAGHTAPTQHSPHINIQAAAATPRTVQSNWPVSQGIETTMRTTMRTPPTASSAIRNSSSYTDHTTTASSHTYGVPHNSPTNLTYPIDLNPISSSHYSAQTMYGQGLNQTSPMYPQPSQYKTTVTADGRHSSIPFPSGDHLPFHNVDHYDYNSPPRQSTLAHHNGKGSPMHISRVVEDDSIGTYGGPPSSSMSQESSTPASAFSVGSISPLGTLATFAEANPSDSSFSASDLSNSKDSPMLTDPPTMYMDGYALGAAYMHDVDGYVGNFGFIPSPAPVLPYHLAYDYPQDADNERGVSTSGQNDVPNSVPTSALLLNPNTYVEPTEDHSHTQSAARGRGRGKARSTAVTGRGKMTQAGKGSPRGHLTLDTASINANDRGPDVGSPGSRKRSVNGMDDDESSDLPHDGSKGGSNTEGSDDREAKRARTQSDSMVTSPPLASSTRRHRATSLLSGSALAVKKGKSRRSVFDNGPQNGLLHTTANESTSMQHSPSPLGQVLPTNPSTENMWPPQSDSTADLYGHTTGDTTDTSARSAVEPESGEGSNEGSAFEDEEDGSEYEDEDDDDDEYVQGRSSGRRKSTTVRRAGKSGGKNVSAAWALEKVQGGSGGPIIDTSTCGVSDETNEAMNMYNRNGKTRRKRISNIPLPIPVPNLTKKSRGRKVPSFPADLASIYGYDASAESSPSGYASREGISKRSTRGRRVPTVVGGPSLEERPFVCEVFECNKRFVRGEHLKRHVRSIHTLDKPFICPQKGCGKTFSRRDNLGQHARVHVTGSG